MTETEEGGVRDPKVGRGPCRGLSPVTRRCTCEDGTVWECACLLIREVGVSPRSGKSRTGGPSDG